MKRQIGHYDVATGEVLEHLNVVAWSPRKRNGFGKDWLAVSQRAAHAVVNMRDKLKGEGLAVFIYLLAEVGFENEVEINKAESAEQIGMPRPSFSRAFKRLVDAGIVLEGERHRSRRYYRLNPEVGWKGAGRNHVIALDEYRKGH